MYLPKSVHRTKFVGASGGKNAPIISLARTKIEKQIRLISAREHKLLTEFVDL